MNELWGRIWKRQYKQGVEDHDLIKMEGNKNGLLIWNNTKKKLCFTPRLLIIGNQ